MGLQWDLFLQDSSRTLGRWRAGLAPCTPVERAGSHVEGRAPPARFLPSSLHPRQAAPLTALLLKQVPPEFKLTRSPQLEAMSHLLSHIPGTGLFAVCWFSDGSYGLSPCPSGGAGGSQHHLHLPTAATHDPSLQRATRPGCGKDPDLLLECGTQSHPRRQGGPCLCQDD